MIPEELIDRLHFGQFILEVSPIRFEDFAGRKSQDLSDERQHPRPETEDSPFPLLHVVVATVSPPSALLVFEPHGGEGRLEMVKMEQESEDKLIPGDRLAGDHEGQREFDSVIKG